MAGHPRPGGRQPARQERQGADLDQVGDGVPGQGDEADTGQGHEQGRGGGQQVASEVALLGHPCHPVRQGVHVLDLGALLRGRLVGGGGGAGGRCVRGGPRRGGLVARAADRLRPDGRGVIRGPCVHGRDDGPRRRGRTGDGQRGARRRGGVRARVVGRSGRAVRPRPAGGPCGGGGARPGCLRRSGRRGRLRWCGLRRRGLVAGGRAGGDPGDPGGHPVQLAFQAFQAGEDIDVHGVQGVCLGGWGRLGGETGRVGDRHGTSSWFGYLKDIPDFRPWREVAADSCQMWLNGGAVGTPLPQPNRLDQIGTESLIVG